MRPQETLVAPTIHTYLYDLGGAIVFTCCMSLYQLSRLYHIGKGKAVPLQAWGGPEGSRKLRFPDFLKTAQDGGKVISLTHRSHLPPGSTPGTHFC
jgi:hypothetical protein